MVEIRDLKFFTTSIGKTPFFEWYNSIKDKSTRRIVTAKLRRLQNTDFRNYKSVGEEVFELRIFYGPGYRIYFGFMRNQIVIILAFCRLIADSRMFF